MSILGIIVTAVTCSVLGLSVQTAATIILTVLVFDFLAAVIAAMLR